MAHAVTPYGNFSYFEHDAIGLAVAAGQFWDEALRPYLDQLQSGDAFVDIGANIGFFAVYAAKRGAYVTAFEASPEVYDLLFRNVMENGVAGLVRTENVALYDEEIELTLNPEWNDWPKLPDGSIDYAKHNNSGGLSLVPGCQVSGGGEGSPYRFQAKTLDSFGVGKAKLIKVDVQGADLRVLQGGIKTINWSRPIVCCEMEPIPARLHGDTEQRFHDFFEQLNYSLEVISYSDYGCKNFVATPKEKA